MNDIVEEIRAFYSLLHRLLQPYGREKIQTKICCCISQLVVATKIDNVDEYRGTLKVAEALIGIAHSILFTGHIDESNDESYSDSVSIG